MKVLEYRWLGTLVHNYEATCDFFENILGMEIDWTNDEHQITMFRLPSGQTIEVYGPSNRNRHAKFHGYNGPVIGLEVDDIEAARDELIAQGALFVEDIKATEDSADRWTHFWGPDGQFIT